MPGRNKLLSSRQEKSPKENTSTSATINQKVMLRNYVRFLIDIYKKGLPELNFISSDRPFLVILTIL